MRLLTILCFLLPIAVAAQPEPPSFCFVLAEDVKAMRPLQGSVTVVHYYLDPVPYHGTPGRDLSKNEVQALQGGPLFRDSSEQWVKYMPVSALGRAHLLVIQGTDTMRIDLSDGPLALIERAWLRADRDTPEVIRFRKGSYAIEHLVDEPWALAATNTMAERLLAEDEATYRKQTAELERVLPQPAANRTTGATSRSTSTHDPGGADRSVLGGSTTIESGAHRSRERRYHLGGVHWPCHVER
ncbi:MAG: hypothetical protein IPO56_12010 [Flavobacteriales bacterium]|nr:hypothetical protein [Flavobacteriales bacterium]